MVSGDKKPRTNAGVLNFGGRFRLGQFCALIFSPHFMHYGCLGGPISGVRTGFAKPKKTTVPLPPKRVDSAGFGTSLKP